MGSDKKNRCAHVYSSIPRGWMINGMSRSFHLHFTIYTSGIVMSWFLQYMYKSLSCSMSSSSSSLLCCCVPLHPACDLDTTIKNGIGVKVKSCSGKVTHAAGDYPSVSIA